jgi:hypothetical protein
MKLPNEHSAALIREHIDNGQNIADKQINMEVIVEGIAWLLDL